MFKFLEKNRKSMGWPLFNLFGKEMQQIIFYAHVHACSLSYTDEEWKTLQSIPKQCAFGLLIIVMIVL